MVIAYFQMSAYTQCMTQEETVQEVTTVETAAPQQVIKKTTIQPEPKAKGEPPQQAFEKKKTIFRANQIVWYILGVIEVLLIFRFVLKLLGANPLTGFTSLIYTITTPLAIPFSGILGSSVMGNSVVEWSTIIAVIVYLCIGWGLVYLFDLIYPISPKDVETQ